MPSGTVGGFQQVEWKIPTPENGMGGNNGQTSSEIRVRYIVMRKHTAKPMSKDGWTPSPNTRAYGWTTPRDEWTPYFTTNLSSCGTFVPQLWDHATDC